MIYRIKVSAFGPALALAALATAQTAQAQQPACVAAADIGDAAIYAMPIAFDAAQTACANRLKRDGFMATGGNAFVAQFREGQDKAWPGAFRLIKTFMADNAAEKGVSDDGFATMIAALPEDSLRPFVDGMVGQMIVGEIKGDSCAQIERGLELIAPLPTQNVSGLVAFIVDMVGLTNLPVCGAAASVTAK